MTVSTKLSLCPALNTPLTRSSPERRIGQLDARRGVTIDLGHGRCQRVVVEHHLALAPTHYLAHVGLALFDRRVIRDDQRFAGHQQFVAAAAS